MSPSGEQILTEFDCPVIELTKKLFLVSPVVIMGPISIVHLCAGTCTISQEPSTRLYEREEVALTSTQLVFKHDFSNKLYCYNIYCTGNYFHNI